LIPCFIWYFLVCLLAIWYLPKLYTFELSKAGLQLKRMVKKRFHCCSPLMFYEENSFSNIWNS
jgi:hypothetical protein